MSWKPPKKTFRAPSQQNDKTPCRQENTFGGSQVKKKSDAKLAAVEKSAVKHLQKSRNLDENVRPVKNRKPTGLPVLAKKISHIEQKENEALFTNQKELKQKRNEMKLFEAESQLVQPSAVTHNVKQNSKVLSKEASEKRAVEVTTGTTNQMTSQCKERKEKRPHLEKNSGKKTKKVNPDSKMPWKVSLINEKSKKVSNHDNLKKTKSAFPVRAISDEEYNNIFETVIRRALNEELPLPSSQPSAKFALCLQQNESRATVPQPNDDSSTCEDAKKSLQMGPVESSSPSYQVLNEVTPTGSDSETPPLQLQKKKKKKPGLVLKMKGQQGTARMLKFEQTRNNYCTTGKNSTSNSGPKSRFCPKFTTGLNPNSTMLNNPVPLKPQKVTSSKKMQMSLTSQQFSSKAFPKKTSKLPKTQIQDKSISAKPVKKPQSQHHNSLKQCQSIKQHIWNLQKERDIGTWVQCCNENCSKWRFLHDVKDPSEVEEEWFCNMNTDPLHNHCGASEEEWDIQLEDCCVYGDYNVGSIVWAKLNGFPWWPAMVDDDPDVEQYYWLNDFSDIPTHYHVVFFDEKAVSRAWVHCAAIMKFTGNEDRKELIMTRVRNIDFAARLKASKAMAMEAIKDDMKSRREKYCFVARYKGSWGKRAISSGSKMLGDSKTKVKKKESYVNSHDFQLIPDPDTLLEEVKDIMEEFSDFSEMETELGYLNSKSNCVKKKTKRKKNAANRVGLIGNLPSEKKQKKDRCEIINVDSEDDIARSEDESLPQEIIENQELAYKQKPDPKIANIPNFDSDIFTQELSEDCSKKQKKLSKTKDKKKENNKEQMNEISNIKEKLENQETEINKGRKIDETGIDVAETCDESISNMKEVQAISVDSSERDLFSSDEEDKHISSEAEDSDTKSSIVFLTQRPALDNLEMNGNNLHEASAKDEDSHSCIELSEDEGMNNVEVEHNSKDTVEEVRQVDKEGEEGKDSRQIVQQAALENRSDPFSEEENIQVVQEETRVQGSNPFSEGESIQVVHQETDTNGSDPFSEDELLQLANENSNATFKDLNRNQPSDAPERDFNLLEDGEE